MDIPPLSRDAQGYIDFLYAQYFQPYGSRPIIQRRNIRRRTETVVPPPPIVPPLPYGIPLPDTEGGFYDWTEPQQEARNLLTIGLGGRGRAVANRLRAICQESVELRSIFARMTTPMGEPMNTRWGHRNHNIPRGVGLGSLDRETFMFWLSPDGAPLGLLRNILDWGVRTGGTTRTTRDTGMYVNNLHIARAVVQKLLDEGDSLDDIFEAVEDACWSLSGELRYE